MFLDISSMQIDMVGFRHLCEGLKKNKTLLSLNVSNNYLGPHMYKHLLKCLPLTRIEVLNISKSKLGDTGVKNLSRLFARANKNHVKKLDISDNKFTCLGLFNLLEELENNRVLEELDMGRNNFFGNLITCLTKFLIQNEHLKILRMCRCELDQDAGEALRKGIERNRTLQCLYIKENSLYDEGFSAICVGLKANHTLKILDVSENRIRERGGTSFGNALKYNKGLNEVNLIGNTITDNAAALILEGIMNNKVIKTIRLKLNPVSYKYKAEIKTILNSHAHKKLKNLQPNLEKKIEKLVRVEKTKKTVFKTLKELKEELEKEQGELDEQVEKMQEKMNKEQAITNTYKDRYLAVQEENRLLEDKKQQVQSDKSEFQKGIRIRIEMKKNEERGILEDIKYLKKELKGKIPSK